MEDYITFRTYIDKDKVFKSEVVEPTCSAELMDQISFIYGE